MSNPLKISGKNIDQDKIFLIPLTFTSGVSAEIDLKGGTLVGVRFESDITSTYLTLSDARSTGGTFVDLKDPTGDYGTAGNAVQLTLGSTATGMHRIPADLAAGLLPYVKFTLESSESVSGYAIVRSFNQ